MSIPADEGLANELFDAPTHAQRPIAREDVGAGWSPETRYATEDIAEETLIPHPALREFVELVECLGHQLTDDEAMLVNVIVRQQNAIVALVGRGRE